MIRQAILWLPVDLEESVQPVIFALITQHVCSMKKVSPENDPEALLV